MYATKRRSEVVPLAICVGDAEDVGNYLETDHLAQGLLEELLPGPVTVISWTKSGADMPSGINPGRRLLVSEELFILEFAIRVHQLNFFVDDPTPRASECQVRASRGCGVFCLFVRQFNFFLMCPYISRQ